MTELSSCYYRDGVSVDDLSAVYICIPVPFKEGEILKIIDPYCQTNYAVLPKNYAPPEHLKKLGDYSDMAFLLYTYCYEDNHFYYDHIQILDCEKCSWAELPKKQKPLILLSQVYQDKLDVGQMLFYYSVYRRESYDALASYLKEE